VTVGEVPEPPDGDEGGGGEEGGDAGGVDGDSEREGDGVDGDESEEVGGAELSEVDAVLLLLLLDASAKTVATGVRLIARIKIAETIFSLSLCCLEKMFVCMTASRDAYRLPRNQKSHEEVIHFLKLTLINITPAQ
jgi:hypothetical protein